MNRRRDCAPTHRKESELANARKIAGPPAGSVRRTGGVGRKPSPAGEAVSDYLRRGGGEWLDRRRRIAGLSFAGAAALGLVSLYQLGIVEHLPDPPLALFDSDGVDAAGEAYAFLKTPDAALGVVSFGVTAVLAGMGGEDRARRQPWIPLALAAKVAVDALAAARLTVEQATRHRRFCFYCLAAAAASFATVPQVIPEARVAWHASRRSR